MVGASCPVVGVGVTHRPDWKAGLNHVVVDWFLDINVNPGLAQSRYR
jgi:hypothetical protein